MAFAVIQVPVRKGTIKEVGSGEDILAIILVDAADEDKTVNRSCHSDVEDTHLLGERFAACMLFDYLVSERVEAGICVGVDNAKAEGRLLINEAIPLGVLFAELAVEVGDEYDGEFEAFAFVDAKDTDGVSRGGFGFCGRPVLTRGEELFDEFDESSNRWDAGIAGEGFELDGPVVQFEEIGPSRGPSGSAQTNERKPIVDIYAKSALQAAPSRDGAPLVKRGEYLAELVRQVWVVLRLATADDAIAEAGFAVILFAGQWFDKLTTKTNFRKLGIG